MATYLTITATHDGSVDNRAVRAALRGIDSTTISESSPVTSPADLSTARDDVQSEEGDPVYRWLIRSGERDEVFTKTTTDAFVGAVSGIDGVTEVEVDGGYEPTEPDEE